MKARRAKTASAKSAAAPRYAPGLEAMLIPIEDLIPDPANARLHGEANLAAIRGSLARFGQRTPIVAQRDPNGALIIRKGNGTTEAARGLGWDQIACVVIEEGDASAVAYAIADNRTGDLATWDQEVLMKSLESLRGDEGLAGATGFTPDEIAKLLDIDPNEDPDFDPEEEWEGMPEFENEASFCQKIIVSFRSPEDVEAFAELVGQHDTITAKTKSIWFPKREREKLTDKAYVDEEDDEGDRF
jgi:hypothetical protein